MTIFNSVIGGGGSVKVPLNDISTLSAIAGDTEATIKWTDVGDLTVNGVLLNEWESTKLVRKISSAPADSSDGTLVLTETVADTYSSTGYTDTGLTNGTSYYYKAFSVGSNGLESGSNSISVTPQQGGWHPGVNTLAYYPMDVDLNDHSGNSLVTTVSGNVSVGTIGGISAGYFGDVGGLIASVPTTGDLTAMGWIYKTGEPNNDSAWLVGYCEANNAGGASLGALIYAKTRPEVVNNKPCVTVFDFPTYGSNIFPDAQLVANQWNHVGVTINRTSGLVTLYVNGVSQGSYTSSGKSQALGSLYISRKDNYDRSWIGYISEAIFESKEWIGTEFSNYYNSTKANYGIS